MNSNKQAIVDQPGGYHPKVGNVPGQQMAVMNPATGLDYLQSLSEVRIHQVLHLIEGISLFGGQNP